jgi:ferredoxin
MLPFRVHRSYFIVSSEEAALADLKERYRDNVPGQFYVDTNCIDCDICRDSAPGNFKRNEAGGYSYVYKQPETEAERKECEQVREECPVDAIGDNGKR